MPTKSIQPHTAETPPQKNKTKSTETKSKSRKHREPLDPDLIPKIIESWSVPELKANMTAFIENLEANPRHKTEMIDELIFSIADFNTRHKPEYMENKNVVFIPPELALVYMITSCMPITHDMNEIFDGLKNVVKRCEMFSEPVEDKITLEEMNLVLDTAQRKLKILDVIAPVKPLRIISLNNTHCRHNCECGIGGEGGKRQTAQRIPIPAAP